MVQNVGQQRCPFCILNNATALVNRIQSVYFEPITRGRILTAISGARGFVRLALGADGYRLAGMIPNLNQGRNPHGPFQYSDAFFDLMDPVPTRIIGQTSGDRVIARARRVRPPSRFGRQPELDSRPTKPILRPPVLAQKRGYETAEFAAKKSRLNNSGFFDNKRARPSSGGGKISLASLEAALKSPDNDDHSTAAEVSSLPATQLPNAPVRSSSAGDAVAKPAVPAGASVASSTPSGNSAGSTAWRSRPLRTLWLPEVPLSVNVLASCKMLELPAHRIRREVGYHPQDAFLDTSVQQERNLLNSFLLAPDGKKEKIQKPGMIIALICAGALENVRLTDKANYHDWLDTPPVTAPLVCEKFFGDCVVHQFAVDCNLADAHALFELVNRITNAIGSSIDLTVVCGGFPSLTHFKFQGQGASTFPNAVQWSVIMANALVSLREGLASGQLIYMGADIRIVDTAFRTFRLRGAIEQLRHRNLGLHMSHKIYVADVLSHSDSLDEATCDAWARQKLYLMIQLILRAMRHQLFSVNR